MRRRTTAALLAALLAAGCGGSRDGGAGAAPGPAAVLVLVPAGEEAPAGVPSARVEVAATPAERERGLMFRDFLAPDSGMLFVYPDSREIRFWMKNCRVPLAAAFLDSGGKVLNIVEMAPGAGVAEDDLPLYPSAGPARFGLEMESGWFARRGIRPGDRIEVAPAVRGVEAR